MCFALRDVDDEKRRTEKGGGAVDVDVDDDDDDGDDDVDDERRVREKGGRGCRGRSPVRFVSP